MLEPSQLPKNQEELLHDINSMLGTLDLIDDLMNESDLNLQRATIKEAVTALTLRLKKIKDRLKQN